MGNSLTCHQGSSFQPYPECIKCKRELDHIDNWRYACYGSVVASIVMLCVYRSLVRNHATVQRVPSYCRVWGTVKLVIGIVLFAEQPSTNSSVCLAYPNGTTFWLYPTVVMIFSLSWFARARRLEQLLAAAGGASLLAAQRANVVYPPASQQGYANSVPIANDAGFAAPMTNPVMAQPVYAVPVADEQGVGGK